MSARDDLDRLDNDWNCHLLWRKGERGNGGGVYVTKERAFGMTLNLPELPAAVRDAFLRDVNAVICAALNAKHEAIRAELVERARAEAKRTLDELGAP